METKCTICENLIGEFFEISNSQVSTLELLLGSEFKVKNGGASKLCAECNQSYSKLEQAAVAQYELGEKIKLIQQTQKKENRISLPEEISSDDELLQISDIRSADEDEFEQTLSSIDERDQPNQQEVAEEIGDKEYSCSLITPDVFLSDLRPSPSNTEPCESLTVPTGLQRSPDSPTPNNMICRSESPDLHESPKHFNKTLKLECRLLTDLPPRASTCPFCVIEYADNVTLLHHIAVDHYPLISDDDYMCNTCGIHTETNEELATHTLTCLRRLARDAGDTLHKVFWCHPCEVGFKLMNDFIEHREACRGIQEVRKYNKCELCMQSKSSAVDWSSHETDCPHGLFYFCQICGAETVTRLEYIKHLNTHRSTGNNSKIFTQRTENRTINQVISPTYEDISDEELKTPNDEPITVPEQTTSDCNKEEEKIVVGDSDSEDEDEITEWRCLSCNVRFIAQLPFLLHVASHEVTQIDRCALCDAPFTSAADICMHMVKHHKAYLNTHEADETDLIPPIDLNPVTPTKTTKPKNTRDVKTQTYFPKSAQTLQPAKPEPTNKPVTRGNSTIPGKLTEQPDIQPSENITDQPTKTHTKFMYDLLVGSKCIICKRKFKNNQILIKHYGIHDGKCNKICLTCGMGYTNKMLYTEHLKSHKTRKAPTAMEQPCSKCSGIISKSVVVRHEELCLNSRLEQRHQCFFCTRSYDSWFAFRTHLSSHSLKCSYCQEKFNKQFMCSMHMAKCSKNPLLRLYRANQNAEEKKIVERRATAAMDVSENESDVLIEPESEPLNDSVADPLPDERDEPAEDVPGDTEEIPDHEYPDAILIYTLNGVRHFKCKECKYISKFRTVVIKHLNVHANAEYRCRKCGAKFASLHTKNRHMLKHHNVSVSDVKVRAAKTESDIMDSLSAEKRVDSSVLFSCDVCSECFSDRTELDIHKLTSHTNHNNTSNNQIKDVKLFTCITCNKQFPSKFARRRHMQAQHSSVKVNPATVNKLKLMFECQICKKSFQSNFAKLQHLKRAHDVLPSTAEVSSNKRSGSPGEENSTDVKRKKKQCKHCTQVFYKKSDYREHQKQAHSELTKNTEDKIDHMHQLIIKSQNEENKMNVDQTAETKDDVSLNQSVNSESELNNTNKTDVVFSEMKDQTEPVPETSVSRKLKRCSYCDQMFDRKSELKIHKQTVHKKKRDGATFDLCDSANFVLNTSNSKEEKVDRTVESWISSQNPIVQAPLTQTNNTSVTSIKTPTTPTTQPVYNNSTDDKNLSCEFCGKTFKFRMSLKQHISKSH